MIDYLDKLYRYSAQGKIEAALESLLEMLLEARRKAPQAENDIREIKTQVIVLSSKLHDLNNHQNIGIIENSQASTIKSQVIFGFSELLHKLDSYKDFYAYLKERDEENTWLSAVNFNTLNATEEYLEKYPDGKYHKEAKHLLYELDKIQQQKRNNKHISISEIANNNFNNLTDIEWWQILSPTWKKIFSNKLKISEAPKAEDFKRLFNLKKLNIHGNREIRSIEPLKKLKKLKFLNFSDTKIVSINILRNLKDLEILWFNYTPVRDLSPLKNLKKLKELDFYNSEVSDLTPISELPNLESINCTLTNVSSIYPVYDMPKLKRLNCNTHLLSRENIENFKLMNPKVEVNLY